MLATVYSDKFIAHGACHGQTCDISLEKHFITARAAVYCKLFAPGHGIVIDDIPALMTDIIIKVQKFFAAVLTNSSHVSPLKD